MRCPSIGDDEPARLRALGEYGLSEDRGLPSLDPIVGMAARMFDCPAAAVNMIGSDHVFLVSRIGIDEFDHSRDFSFCAHAIHRDEVTVVEDALLDPRFHDNPLVTGGFIRFYAGAPLRSPSGHALGVLCVIDDQARAQFSDEDRTRLAELAKLAVDRLELRRIEAAAEQGVARLQASAETSPNAVVSFDSDSRITAWNRAAAQMFGRDTTEVLGQSIECLVSPDDRKPVRACVAGVLAGEAPGTDGLELSAVRRSGEGFPVEIHWSRWREGGETHFGAIIRDMTEKRRERDALYRLANFDSLTGLPNRNLLLRRLEEALSGESGLALVRVELGGFGDVENSLGHLAGDELLQHVGECIRAVLPPTADLARIGRNEFAVVLPGDQDPLRVGEVARAITEALSRSVSTTGVPVASRCGMALGPMHGDSPEELMANAGLALFQAGQQGGGSTFMFVPALRAAAVARRMHEVELHRAVEQGEFMLFYQPLVRLSDQSLIGAEALIRWRHPERGVLAPAAFLPAIERGALAEQVGSWVIRTACAQAAEWRAEQPDFRVSINLFAAQFRDGHLPTTLLEALAVNDLRADALELEITENIVLDRQPSVLRQLHELRGIGFGLAFDDFGTGYASLNLLRSFPISHIKIDRSFTSMVHSSAKDQAIVASLIDLAAQLDLQVVAEGVESRDDCEFLTTHGCPIGQGFYFGKPVPPEVFEERFFTSRSSPVAIAG